ncbi:MAG: sigma-54 dependent transcriptional regulator [Planctomycetia bacterium]|nr:sigma-54 dependent transcriptional regulator [Planctomycetia bacterium]
MATTPQPHTFGIFDSVAVCERLSPSVIFGVAVQQPRILVIDPAGRSGLPYASLVARLQPMELRVEESLEAAMLSIARDSWDLGIVTVRQPGPSAEILFAAVLRADPQLPIVVIDPHSNAVTARACLQAGAGDYLDLKRVEIDLEDTLARLLVSSRRRAAEEVLRRAIERPYTFDDFVGESQPMQQVYSIIDRVASSNVDVLVTGETGTGKELVARSLHRRSRRASGPFVPVDCGAIPDMLLESELFGHERGAFTGADSRRMGLVEFADGGTLFLDEIGELPLPLQAKLLRVLQERRVRRVGARQENPVDVRVVAATARNLDTSIERGEFRRDLFYRIHVVRIDLPPLRHRGDDIGLLAEYFTNRAGLEMQRPVGGMSSDTYQILKNYRWPGNVRELQNVVRRAVAMTRSPIIAVEDLPDEIVVAAGQGAAIDATAAGYFAMRDQHMAIFEKQYLNELLMRHGGDVSAAAREARLPRGTLYRLMKTNGIDGAMFRREGVPEQAVPAAELKSH